MGLQGDIARESDAQWFCEKIEEQMKKYPEATKALKELGIEALNILSYTPEWADKYYKLFRP